MAEDKRAKLEGELESAERTLRDALDFMNDDRYLTPEGIAKREVLRKDVEAIERDLEAIRQEHGLG
jgi:predicted  nucleic acid-binding Zn-ribbon protein